MRTLVLAILATLTSVASAQPVDPPEILTAPSGWMLPAAVLYGKASVDHAGGVGVDARIGLGDVAEFGLATADPMAVRRAGTKGIARVVQDEPPREMPFATATFRLGVVEDRLFRGQPAIALGFRKSFEHRAGDVTTRFAELHLVASKHLGPRAAIHVGMTFWDASIQEDGRAPWVMHDHDVAAQVRPIGGVELRPLPDTAILVDLSWIPVRFGTERIALRPVLAWGLRYELSDRVALQSGVRVTDVADPRDRDARVFAQATVSTWSLSRWVARHR